MAHDARDLWCESWALMRLLLALADRADTREAVALLPLARRAVIRLGDRLVSAALHVYVAQLESKRGLLDGAWNHLRVGRDSLQGIPTRGSRARPLLTPHVSLTCRPMLTVRCARHSWRCQWRSSLDTLSPDARHWPISGIFTWPSVMSNVRQSAWRSRCECATREAVTRSRFSTDWRSSISQAVGSRSVRRHLHGFRETLGRQRQVGSSTGCGVRLTGRLDLRLGRVKEALRRINAAWALSGPGSDTALSSSLRLLKAEAAARLGRLDEAGTLIHEAAVPSDEPSLDSLAEVQRVAGIAIALAGDRRRARHHFDRAASLLAASGNRIRPTGGSSSAGGIAR